MSIMWRSRWVVMSATLCRRYGWRQRCGCASPGRCLKWRRGGCVGKRSLHALRLVEMTKGRMVEMTGPRRRRMRSLLQCRRGLRWLMLLNELLDERGGLLVVASEGGLAVEMEVMTLLVVEDVAPATTARIGTLGVEG